MKSLLFTVWVLFIIYNVQPIHSFTGDHYVGPLIHTSIVCQSYTGSIGYARYTQTTVRYPRCTLEYPITIQDYDTCRDSDIAGNVVVDANLYEICHRNQSAGCISVNTKRYITCPRHNVSIAQPQLCGRSNNISDFGNNASGNVRLQVTDYGHQPSSLDNTRLHYSTPMILRYRQPFVSVITDTNVTVVELFNASGMTHLLNSAYVYNAGDTAWGYPKSGEGEINFGNGYDYTHDNVSITFVTSLQDNPSDYAIIVKTYYSLIENTITPLLPYEYCPIGINVSITTHDNCSHAATTLGLPFYNITINTCAINDIMCITNNRSVYWICSDILLQTANPTQSPITTSPTASPTIPVVTRSDIAAIIIGGITVGTTAIIVLSVFMYEYIHKYRKYSSTNTSNNRSITVNATPTTVQQTGKTSSMRL